jgi:hypothetical protein
MEGATHDGKAFVFVDVEALGKPPGLVAWGITAIGTFIAVTAVALLLLAGLARDGSFSLVAFAFLPLALVPVGIYLLLLLAASLLLRPRRLLGLALAPVIPACWALGTEWIGFSGMFYVTWWIVMPVTAVYALLVPLPPRRY